ncbi:hypothetical protein J2Z62_000123 [Mycoplasmoides fastidiosum]|uniref:Lipoprotein n=1 Tax=Mycoplasmoides fastidiosum TaxID=92758 RepID=A0ABU0LYB8_9BACT|nr:hypothetical protein [Mycoplasmoides fastidiosum]MDQ0513685.1 hypothetical protein [Mycoplasmoides fastidiosum]UUD37896.1 hypothetical protein NPA10_00665 [Mycoplasmoides fastidiosum]
MKKINLFKSSKLQFAGLNFGFVSSVLLSACAAQTQIQKPSDDSESNHSESNNNIKNDNNSQSDDAQTNSKSDSKTPRIPRANQEQISRAQALVHNEDFQNLLEYENRSSRDQIFNSFFDILDLAASFKNNETVNKALPYLNIQKSTSLPQYISRQSQEVSPTNLPNLIQQLKSEINNFGTQEKDNFESIFNQLIDKSENLVKQITDLIRDKSEHNLKTTSDSFILAIHKYLIAQPNDLEQILSEILSGQDSYFKKLKILADKIEIIETTIINLESWLKEAKNFITNHSSLFTNSNGFSKNFKNFLDILEQQVLFLKDRTQNNKDPNSIDLDSSLLGEIQKILFEYKEISLQLNKTVKTIVFNKNLLVNNSEAINLLALNLDVMLPEDIAILKNIEKSEISDNIYNLLTTDNQTDTNVKSTLEEIKKISDNDTENKLSTELAEFKDKWEKFKKFIWIENSNKEIIYPFLNLARELDALILNSSNYQDILKISAKINEFSHFYFKIITFVSSDRNIFLAFEDSDDFDISEDSLFRPESVDPDIARTPNIETFIQKLDELIKKENTQTHSNENFSFNKLKTELEKLQTNNSRTNSANPKLSQKIFTIIGSLSRSNLLSQKDKLTFELAEQFNYGK